MNWKLSNEVREEHLKNVFSRLDIDYSTPGFCDTPAFLKAEKSNARILESYAEFIEVRSYDQAYLNAAAQKIAQVCEVVRKAVEDDGRLGACVDASMMIGRMLDKLGIWNYVAKSTLSISYPTKAHLSPSYFVAIDTRSFDSPHAIVIAPPFGIIDVTLRYQPYDSNQEKFLPHSVLAESYSVCKWADEDLACDELRAMLKLRGTTMDQFLRKTRPEMLQVINTLPPRELVIDETSLKYVIVAVGGSIEPLEGMVGYKPGGITAFDLFHSQVLPLVQD